MVTREDVARHAGTSTAVVSYVVNNGPRPVAPATRERVLAAVTELGYRPNAIARSLSGARSNMIGVVVDELDQCSARLLEGITSTARDAGMATLIGRAEHRPDVVTQHVRSFVDRQADGILLLTRQAPADALAEVERSSTPAVSVFNPLPAGYSPLVDPAHALLELENHLSAHGHERILLPRHDPLDDTGTHPVPFVHAALEALNSDLAPTALVCPSVAAALTLRVILDHHGRSLPALAAVSHRLDEPHAELADLTVAAHPWQEVGSLAAHRLVDEIEASDARSLGMPPVAPQLCCRSSCLFPASRKIGA